MAAKGSDGTHDIQHLSASSRGQDASESEGSGKAVTGKSSEAMTIDASNEETSGGARATLIHSAEQEQASPSIPTGPRAQRRRPSDQHERSATNVGTPPAGPQRGPRNARGAYSRGLTGAATPLRGPSPPRTAHARHPQHSGPSTPTEVNTLCSLPHTGPKQSSILTAIGPRCTVSHSFWLHRRALRIRTQWHQRTQPHEQRGRPPGTEA